jgi:hypothetical protein
MNVPKTAVAASWITTAIALIGIVVLSALNKTVPTVLEYAVTGLVGGSLGVTSPTSKGSP